MTLFANIADRAKKRASYARTVQQLTALDPRTAEDLNISRFDAEQIARRAVYGN